MTSPGPGEPPGGAFAAARLHPADGIPRFTGEPTTARRWASREHARDSAEDRAEPPAPDSSAFIHRPSAADPPPPNARVAGRRTHRAAAATGRDAATRRVEIPKRRRPVAEEPA